MSSSKLGRSSPPSPPSQGRLAHVEFTGDSFVLVVVQISYCVWWWVFPISGVTHQAAMLSQRPVSSLWIHGGGVFILPPLAKNTGHHFKIEFNCFFVFSSLSLYFFVQIISKMHTFNHLPLCFGMENWIHFLCDHCSSPPPAGRQAGHWACGL